MSSDAYLVATLPDVGRLVRTLRKRASKTQAELAQAVGMRQEALSRFETGRGNDFSLAKLLRLLHALDAEIDIKPMHRRPNLHDVLQERRRNANTGPDSR